MSMFKSNKKSSQGKRAKGPGGGAALMEQVNNITNREIFQFYFVLYFTAGFTNAKFQ